MPFVIIFIVVLILIFTLPQTGMDSTVCAILITAVAFILPFPLYTFFGKKHEKMLAKVKDIIALDYNGRSLHLKGRSRDIEPLVQFEDVIHSTIAHKDSEYIFTSVTVGGITTGGVSKTKEYDYIQSKENLGLFKFLFDGKDIESIYLTPELFEKAKESYIAEYLDKKTKSIKLRKDVKYSKELQSMRGYSLEFRNQLTMANQQAYPSKYQCEQILRWICGVD